MKSIAASKKMSVLSVWNISQEFLPRVPFLLFADEEWPELVIAFLEGSFDDLPHSFLDSRQLTFNIYVIGIVVAG